MIRVGDTVVRMLAGSVEMKLIVADIDDRFIYCGAERPVDEPPSEYMGWKFDREQGYEVDEDLGWGVPGEDGLVYTGSWLVMERVEEENA